MAFRTLLHKKYRLLLPFSWLYGLGVSIFNGLYDKRIRKATQFPLPIICIGNLSVGGTGKSPMVEYLVELLQKEYQLATISRGYKRKTRGFVMADEQTGPEEIGDEPMQFHAKFPQLTVVVGEDRVAAVAKLLTLKPSLEVVLLDDAFQHRALQAGFQILLTDYNNRFTQDYLLPAGQLRDHKKSYGRANCIVVTKCPKNLSTTEQMALIQEIQPQPNQVVLFAALEYGQAYGIFDHLELEVRKAQTIILVTGIANPHSLIEELKQYSGTLIEFHFPDHYAFQQADIDAINQAYEAAERGRVVIITTEKDQVKLKKFDQEFVGKAIGALPVRHLFLLDGKEKFDTLIYDFIKSFEKQ